MPKQKGVDKEKAKARIEKGRRAKWWQRKGSMKRGFSYADASGKKLKNKSDLERIKSLVIPPAWEFVRISPASSTAIQAVGMDTTGRVQYIYHSKFSEKQQQKKFEKIERFGKYLPQLRRETNKQLRGPGFPREKVLALMVRLINSLYMRMGGEGSAENFKTYGITTLKNNHLEIKSGGELVFEFVGKSHVKQRQVLVDAKIAKLMKKLKELGTSRKLFHYLDEDNKPRTIKPADINRYIKSLTAKEFSSKDLRTWGATLLAAIELAEIGPAEGEKQLKKNIVIAVQNVAEQLGNTPAVCRSSYIHPTVLDAYAKGIVLDKIRSKNARATRQNQRGYDPEERSLIKLFKRVNGGR